MAGKDSKRKPKAGADGDRVALAAHPRARRSIRRLRGRAGLAGLIIVSLLSLRAGVPAFDAVIRGLAGGIAAQFVAWGAGILVWRQLVLGELMVYREAQENAAAERRAANERLAAERLAASGAGA